MNVGNVKIINATLRVLKYEAAYSSLGTSLQLNGLDFPDFLMTCFMCDSTNSRVRRVSSTMLSIPVVSASGFCSFSISVEGLSYPIFSGSLQLPAPFIPESIEPTRVLGNGAALVTIKGSSSSWFVSGASLCRFCLCLNANDARFCSTTSGITSSSGIQIICPVPILNSGFVNVAIFFDGLCWAPVLSSLLIDSPPAIFKSSPLIFSIYDEVVIVLSGSNLLYPMQLNVQSSSQQQWYAECNTISDALSSCRRLYLNAGKYSASVTVLGQSLVGNSVIEIVGGLTFDNAKVIGCNLSPAKITFRGTLNPRLIWSCTNNDSKSQIVWVSGSSYFLCALFLDPKNLSIFIQNDLFPSLRVNVSLNRPLCLSQLAIFPKVVIQAPGFQIFLSIANPATQLCLQVHQPIGLIRVRFTCDIDQPISCDLLDCYQRSRVGPSIIVLLLNIR